MKSKILRVVAICLGILTLVMLAYFWFYDRDKILLAIIPGLIGALIQKYNKKED